VSYSDSTIKTRKIVDRNPVVAVRNVSNFIGEKSLRLMGYFIWRIKNENRKFFSRINIRLHMTFLLLDPYTSWNISTLCFKKKYLGIFSNLAEMMKKFMCSTK
jgi:hypothetical protein